jgi:lysophospholipase L1-like esterase
MKMKSPIADLSKAITQPRRGVMFASQPHPANVRLEDGPGLAWSDRFDEMCIRQERGDSTNLPPGGSNGTAYCRWPSRCKPARDEQRAWASRAVLFLAAILLMLSFVTFPAPPPDNDVDSSLSGVLNYAHSQGLQFGPELALTYGPLGFLMFFYYSPHAAGLRMVADVALCLVVATGLCLVAWRLRPLWRWLLLILFFWIAPNLPTRADLVIDVALLCWGLLCFVESGPRLPVCLWVFAVLAAFSALAKVSFLFVATASLALIGCDLALRGQWRLAAGIVAGFGTAFVLGWTASGQALAHLGTFLANGLAVARAYNGALGWEGLALLRTIGLVLGPLVLSMILLRTLSAFGTSEKRRIMRRLVLLAWLSLLTFAVWKYGCVRSGREIVFLSFVAVLAFALEAVPCEARVAPRWARGLALGVCALSLISMQEFCFVSWPRSLGEPFCAFGRNVVWLSHPGDFHRQMGQAIEAKRREAQLPRCRELIGRASVDVFGQCQAYALHNDLNYRPRPVFQSYVACSRSLMQLNEQFYLSPAAPEYVLFRLYALDRKSPSLEDASVLLTLLANYQPVATEGPFLLLKSAGAGPCAVSLVRDGTVRPGQPIDLREFGDADLWLEISLEPTLLGRLRQVLSRPPTVRLAAWHEPGGKLLVRNRAPAQMMAAGFLASPLLLNNEDVLNLYADRAIIRPGACSVELLPGERGYWQDAVRYRIYKIKSRLGRCVPAELAARLFEPRPENRTAEPGSVGAGAPEGNTATKAAHRFTLFRPSKWRPTAPPPGNWEENLTFGLFVVAPVLSIGLLLLFIKRVKRSKVPTGWGRLALGNALVLLCLVTPLLLAGETYFRFFYDTTDSLAYTRVSERWVHRHWHVNNAGCRDNVAYSPALAPGKRRISFVGDSFTAGHGIKDVEDRFPNRLRRAHPDWEIHVVASVGLDTGNELALMKKAFARGYQVDQVVLVYCLNDIGDLMPPQADATGRVLAELDNSGWLWHNSYMMNLWHHHYTASRDPYLGNYCFFVREAYGGLLWQQQKERLKAFRDLIEAHGGHLAVVTFPFLHALGPNYEYRFIHDQLNRLWQELGVPHLDLLSLYKDLPSSRLTVNRFDAHPNEYANKLAAEAIDKWLQELDATRTGPG